MATDDRVKCEAAGCKNRILIATAARTGGICRPCEQRIAREQHEEYVRANRREVDRYAGITDPVELVALLAAPKIYDELIVEKPFPDDVGRFFGSLPASQLERIAALAVSYMPDRENEAESIARWLAAFTDADLGNLQQAWVDADLFYPGIIFRGAPAHVREQVIQTAQTRSDHRNHALMALAWIGDDAVVELFARWRARPPHWRGELYVPPEHYARVAGWELDESGRRRDLYSRSTSALIASDDDAPSPVQVVRPAAGRCPWCTGPLTTLLELETSEPRFAGLSLPARVVICDGCAIFTPIFMKLDRNGTPVWHDRNEKPAYALTEPGPPWTDVRRLVIGEPRNPLHAADSFLPTTVSQIGGAPGWIQDSEFPRCPECLRTMHFIAQVSREELEDESEGCYYAFWCGDCRVTATSFQTT